MNEIARLSYHSSEWESLRRAISDNIISYQEMPWHVVNWKDGYTLNERQQQEMYNDVYKPIVDWELEIQRSNKRLMKAIKSVRGRKFCSALSRWLHHLKEECYHRGQMKCEIVRQPTGEVQKSEPYYGRHITQEWCDQSCGYCGDDYYGFMYVQIDEKRYLKVNYSM
jgi:hypothetical protein